MGEEGRGGNGEHKDGCMGQDKNKAVRMEVKEWEERNEASGRDGRDERRRGLSGMEGAV